MSLMDGTSGVIILMVSDMNKEGFLNTKWDVRDWSEDGRRAWQEFMFTMGFEWCGDVVKSACNLDAAHYFIDFDGELGFSLDHQQTFFDSLDYKQMHWDDAFLGIEPFLENEQGQSDSDKPRSQPRNKYDREILPGVYVDVYDVLRAFKTNSPALDHAAKKLLASGERGHKDRLTDLKECIASIQAEIDSVEEWS